MLTTKRSVEIVAEREVDGEGWMRMIVRVSLGEVHFWTHGWRACAPSLSCIHARANGSAQISTSVRENPGLCTYLDIHTEAHILGGRLDKWQRWLVQ